MRKILSICIPTYNGGNYLKYNVNKLIGLSLKYNFDICVSDNASTDGTQEYMLNLITKYNFIRYHRNNENMGAAYNFDCVLKMADTEYAWFLGDDDEIIEEGLIKVIEILNKNKPEICVVNGNDGNKRVKDIQSKLYMNKNEVLAEIGEHMSWISSLILSKKVVNNLKISNIKDNAFPHLIEIFKYLNYNCNLYWLDYVVIKIQNNIQSRYQKKILDYFIKDWYGITTQIGKYSNEAKQCFIKKEVKKAFSLRAILGMRCLDILNKESLSRIKYELKFFPKKVQFFLYIVSKIPINLLIFIRKIKRIINNKKEG